jgi:hypothetical protein
MQLDMQLLLADFGKRKGHLLSFSLHLYFTLKEVGVFGVGLDVLLSLFWSVQNQVYPSLLAP